MKLTRQELENMPFTELRSLAAVYGARGRSREELVNGILEAYESADTPQPVVSDDDVVVPVKLDSNSPEPLPEPEAPKKTETVTEVTRVWKWSGTRKGWVRAAGPSDETLKDMGAVRVSNVYRRRG